MRQILLNGTYYELAPKSEIVHRAISPWKAKVISRGSREYDDFSEAELEEYHDFRNGIGLQSELPDQTSRNWFGQGVDVSTARSAVLGPLVTTAGSFGIAPVKILDFQSATYAIADNAFRKWNKTTSNWDYADPYLIHDCEAAWDELVDGDATVTLDTTIEKQGSGCVKMAVGAGLADGDIIATDNITSLDLDTPVSETIVLWVRCSKARASGDLQLLIDETAECPTPSETLNIPALAADTWTQCTLTLADPGASDLNAIISVGLKFTANAEACDIYVDHIRGTWPNPIDMIVVTDDTDEYLIVSTATAAFYTPDGTTWTALSDVSGYLAVLGARLYSIDTDGANYRRSNKGDIDAIDTYATTHYDADDAWTNPQKAYDGILTNYAYDSTDATLWTAYLEFGFGAGVLASHVRIYELEAPSVPTDNTDIDAYYDGGWRHVFDGASTFDAWVNHDIGVNMVKTITAVRVRFKGADGDQARVAGIQLRVDDRTLMGNFGTVYELFDGKLLADGSAALYFIGTKGLYSIDRDENEAYRQEVAYPPLTYAGHAGMYWNANLWAATGYGILKIGTSQAIEIGPNQDDGLPSGYQGYIYDMVAVNNWLVFCVNGGTTDKSSILKRNSSLGGNLQVYTTSAVDNAITCLHHSPSSLYSNGRLWFSEGTNIKYMMFPDTTSNVKQISTYQYVDDSDYFELPIFRKMAAINKTALGVAAITKSCTEADTHDETVEIYYGLNGATPTTHLGDFTTSPRPTILTFGSGLGTEFYRIQLAYKLTRGTTNTDSPELESLLFYYLATVTRTSAWTFDILATGSEGDRIFTEFEAIYDTNTLVAFYPSGDSGKTSYNVKLRQMPSREWWENQGGRAGQFQVTVSEIFKG